MNDPEPLLLSLILNLIELSLEQGKAAAANEFTLQKKVFQVKTQRRSLLCCFPLILGTLKMKERFVLSLFFPSFHS